MSRNNRSLSECVRNVQSNLMFSRGIGSVMPTTMSTITNTYGATTVGFNNQYKSILDTLSTKRNDLAQTVQDKLAQNPDYIGSRNAGVKLAWQYEKADIEMSGSGSANWNADEQNQILNSKTGTVTGAEGHHQKNVADHPEYQADPDNIKFYKTRAEHLQEGHDGNFQNESDAPFINKDKMLENTNHKRVFANEIRGATISAAIGFGIAFTISAVVELATMGIDAVEMSDLVIHSVRAGVEGSAISSVVYCSGRAMSNFLQDRGVDLLSKTGALINYAAVGAVSIALVSTIQFVKLKMNGIEASEAFKEVGKNVLFSGALLALSIVAQGLYGGYAGLIVSTSVGLVVLTVNVVDASHQRKFHKQIEEYIIEEHKPIYVM